MRISVDVKCYKTSDNGTTLTALLTEDAILMIEPEKQQPTKHEGWVVVNRWPDRTETVERGSIYSSLQSLRDDLCLMETINPVVAHVTWED